MKTCEKMFQEPRTPWKMRVCCRFSIFRTSIQPWDGLIQLTVSKYACVLAVESTWQRRLLPGDSNWANGDDNVFCWQFKVGCQHACLEEVEKAGSEDAEIYMALFRRTELREDVLLVMKIYWRLILLLCTIHGNIWKLCTININKLSLNPRVVTPPPVSKLFSYPTVLQLQLHPGPGCYILPAQGLWLPFWRYDPVSIQVVWGCVPT